MYIIYEHWGLGDSISIDAIFDDREEAERYIRRWAGDDWEERYTIAPAVLSIDDTIREVVKEELEKLLGNEK